MRKLLLVAIITLAYAGEALPQARSLDWPSYGGDARRTGWQKSDTRITHENIKDFQLIWKRKLEGSLTPPVVIGMLISYKGFKELGLLSNSAGDLWAIDVDLNRVFWKKRFGTAATSSGPCAAVAVTPALTPPVTFSAGRRPAAPANARASKNPPRVGGPSFGGSRSVFMLANDGVLHQVNSSDGSDQFPAVNFLPAGARASNLTVNGSTIYTSTSGNCNGTPNGIWGIDLNDDEPRTVQFALNGADAPAMGGFAIGNDGTVYVQTGPGEANPAANKWANTLLALESKDLKVKDYFIAPGSGPNAVTPVVFEHKGRDIIATAGTGGRIYLLDSVSVGGADHKAFLGKSERITSDNGGIWGGLSTWQDEAGTRWLAAPVHGPLSADLKPALTNGAAPHGAIVAFKVEEQGGALALTPAWVSRDMTAPVPPVITAGAVFTLSTGGRAVLYALDGTTGKEMYSSGNQVEAAGSLTGLTVSNGRVYFTTTDGTLYAFGIFMEI